MFGRKCLVSYSRRAAVVHNRGLVRSVGREIFNAPPKGTEVSSIEDCANLQSTLPFAFGQTSSYFRISALATGRSFGACLHHMSSNLSSDSNFVLSQLTTLSYSAMPFNPHNILLYSRSQLPRSRHDMTLHVRSPKWRTRITINTQQADLLRDRLYLYRYAPYNAWHRMCCLPHHRNNANTGDSNSKSIEIRKHEKIDDGAKDCKYLKSDDHSRNVTALTVTGFLDFCFGLCLL